ncbi:mechanosensitive ion channel family protein [Candidatus Pacearchaeota archaeon]|nr:mechanosensitive ion channel family protein [Candidatus Pacearchaeota archaeon]
MLESYITNDYIRAIVILVGLLIIFRIIVSVLKRIILKIVNKTKTDIDNVIIKKSSLPITLILLFISVQIAMNELTLSQEIQDLISKVMNSFIIILIGYVTYVVLNVFFIEVWKSVVKRANRKTIESLTNLMQGIFEIIIVILVILYVLYYWGVQITPLLAGLGIVGLAVALALQPTLNNIFSGIAMILDDSVRVGDLVYIDANTKGKILKIGLRSTKINTFDNEVIIVPNSKLADSMIQNVALPEPKSRVVIPFSVAYGSNINKVKEIVLKEIKSITKVCSDPEPFVRFIEMGTSSLNFKAYFYVESYDDRFPTIDEANTKIYNALRKNKIEIPFPQMDVHLKKE